jgi:hypothetical protein
MLFSHVSKILLFPMSFYVQTDIKLRGPEVNVKLDLEYCYRKFMIDGTKEGRWKKSASAFGKLSRLQTKQTYIDTIVRGYMCE